MSVEERSAFDAWRADPRNQAALDALHEMWGELAVLKYVEPTPPRRKPRPRMMGALVAAVALLVVGVGASALLRPSNAIETAIGEQRTQTLADGSVLSVNVVSHVSVSMTGEQRLIELHEGEAAFRANASVASPFVVLAGDYEARATGTVFNVRQREDTVEIAVRSGVVQVCRKGAPDRVLVTLVAGDALELPARWSDSLPLTPRRVAAEDVGQWQMRVVTYENTAVADVVQDLNRYFAHQISIDGAALAEMKVTLRLQIEDRQGAVNTFSRLLGAKAVERGGMTVLMQ